jgi:hypothetical protein
LAKFSAPLVEKSFNCVGMASPPKVVGNNAVPSRRFVGFSKD